MGLYRKRLEARSLLQPMFRKTPPQKLNYFTEVSENLWTVFTDYQCLGMHSYICDYYYY